MAHWEENCAALFSIFNKKTFEVTKKIQPAKTEKYSTLEVPSAVRIEMENSLDYV